MRVIFLEEAEDSAAVVRTLNGGCDSMLIAISPRASYELDRLGIAYRNPEDYYSSRDAFELGREHTLPVLAAACEYADAFLARHSPICQLYDLRPFEANRYKLSFAFDSVCLTALALEQIFAQERPSHVSYFSTYPDLLNDQLSFHQESIVSGLVPLIADAWKVHSELLRRTARPARACWRERADRARRFMGNGLVRCLDLLRPRQHGGLRVEDGRLTLLVLDQGYDIDLICERMVKGKSGQVIYWDSPAEQNSLRGFTGRGISLDGDLPDGDGARAKFEAELVRSWELLRQDEKFCSFFRFRDVDTFPVLERRLSHIVSRNTFQQLAIRVRAGLVFDRFKPSAVIATEINSCWRIEIAKVAKSRQIPVVVHQHGGSYGYAQVYAHEYTALKWADFFLAYGDGVSDVFEEKRGNPRSPVGAKVLPVGSARLDTLVRRHGDCRQRPPVPAPCEAVVVYVCDAMAGRNRRLPPVDYENNQYFRWQKRIITAFERHPSVLFLIKPFPDPLRYSPLPEYVGDRHASHLRVVDDTPFSELLGRGDLFLIDYVGTALLEALTTTKKIVLFADRVARDIVPAALEILKRRVVCATSVDDYIASIESILHARAWGDVAVPDDEFLRMYGTHLNDGRSCDRAIEALLRIARDPRAIEASSR